MCTAVSFSYGEHYFGRNLDLEYAYQEQVVLTPRQFSLPFRRMPALNQHHAMIGMATVSDGYPLYYEATNEFGLSMAGLYFPGEGRYQGICPGRDNIASFELIPWILGQAASLSEARNLLERLNLTEEAFSSDFPPQSLHWLLADRYSSLVVEPGEYGFHVYDNPVGILTNAPEFPYHLHRLSDFQGVSTGKPSYSNGIPSVPSYSSGMGALGLPGDFSSASRFVKAAFVAHNSVSDGTESSNVTQFFHILRSVAMPKGCVLANNGEFATTRYSSCCNTDKGIYYYTTYDNCRITAIELRKHKLSENKLFCYDLRKSADFVWEN